MQALDDHDVPSAEFFSRPKGSVAVVIYRLADRPALLEREQLVLHQGEVGGARVESRDADQPSFPAIQAVVIVQTQAGDSGFRKDAVETGGQRGLPASAVTSDGNEDWPARIDTWVHIAPVRTLPAKVLCSPIQTLNVRDKLNE